MSDYNNENLSSQPLNDTDLTGMDFEQAKAYVISFIQSLIETQRQKRDAIREINDWDDRIKMATERNRNDLKLEAEKRVFDLRENLTNIENDERELSDKVEMLKENLKKIKNQFNYSVDAEALLANIEMLVGKKDELSDEFKKEKAQADLEALKKKMENNE